MYNKQITLRIDSKTYQQIEKIAGKHMRKFSDMVRVIIKENLKSYEQVKPKLIEANNGKHTYPIWAAHSVFSIRFALARDRKSE